MKKIAVLMLAVWTASLFPEILKEDGDTLVYRQADGETVRLHKRPKRVVIAFASLLHPWYASGGTAIARPSVKSIEAIPEAARALPPVGEAVAVNPELILLRNPDLVLLNHKLARHRNAAKLLRKSGIETLCADYRNYDEFLALLNLFGTLNGNSGAARETGNRISREIQEIREKTKSRRGPKTAVVFAATAGFSLETPDTNAGGMVRMLGGKNIVPAARGRARIPFSYEKFLLENPEVILIVPMGSEAALREKFRREIMSQPAWKELSAEKNRRVHFLPPQWFLFMPGTDYPAAFRHLSGLLYPELKQ